MSEEKTTSDGTYYLVYIVLAIMTFAQLAVSFSGLGPMRLPVNMGIASVQVILLSFVFMHLKGSDSLTKITAAAALFFLGLLFLFTITDYLTRQWLAY
jgi:cytochrome c oxidase subunit IV